MNQENKNPKEFVLCASCSKCKFSIAHVFQNLRELKQYLLDKKMGFPLNRLSFTMQFGPLYCENWDVPNCLGVVEGAVTLLRNDEFEVKLKSDVSPDEFKNAFFHSGFIDSLFVNQKVMIKHIQNLQEKVDNHSEQLFNDRQIRREQAESAHKGHEAMVKKYQQKDEF